MSILPSAILFDMDGTLTVPMLDFPLIKREMGIGQRPILEALAEMDEPHRRRAEAILLGHEDTAAAASTLNPGCHELLTWLGGRGIRTAIVTRNSRRCAEIVLARHGMRVDALITRELGRFKPDPSPLVEACRMLAVGPATTWMVGDGQYDIEAGIAAGIATVWLSHGRTRAFAAEPWRAVNDLAGLTSLLRECLSSL
jgi:HAD superfamily hydrolase (TIGR01509 family)